MNKKYLLVHTYLSDAELVGEIEIVPEIHIETYSSHEEMMEEIEFFKKEFGARFFVNFCGLIDLEFKD